VRSAELEAEWHAAQESLNKHDALELLALRFPKGVIMHMVGIARVRVTDDRYTPDESGKWSFISPIRVADARSPFTEQHYQWAVLGGDLADLVCWDTGATGAWALRCGAAEWLGCASRNEPTPIRRSPVSWLRHRCSGLALLTRDRVRQYEILSECNDIVAEDDYHADALNAMLAYPYPRKAVFVA
jgi:hypothetical protein